MLVQVYVDDIIFGSTKPSMVKDFEELMQKEFKMSSMGELTFFLGLQVKQTTAGIFLSQDKYVKDILNKFDFRTIKPASTPIEAHKSLGKDEEGEDVDVHLYRSMMIWVVFMYLTASRPDIMFAVCLCARFQVTPKVSHMHAVKRIFRYLKHQPKLGLWYPKDSPFHLEAFSDSDYAGDNHDRRSTSGGMSNFLEEDCLLGNAKEEKKTNQLWLYHLQRLTYVAAACCVLRLINVVKYFYIGTADFQGTAEAQGAVDIPQSPNDYTPTGRLGGSRSKTFYLKSQTDSKPEGLNSRRKLSKGVKALVKHHILWVKSQKLKKRGKKQKKKVSSVKLGRNKDESNLSEEHHDQDDHNHTTFVYEDFDATEAVVTPDLERKSDETEQVHAEWDTEEREQRIKVIDSPDGEYLIIYRANTHFRAFDTLWEILHILDIDRKKDIHIKRAEIRMLDHGMEVKDET
ncbi:uncharacterized mitochondrial protein-like protein [Tanacetum coccineum]